MACATFYRIKSPARDVQAQSPAPSLATEKENPSLVFLFPFYLPGERVNGTCAYIDGGLVLLSSERSAVSAVRDQ